MAGASDTRNQVTLILEDLRGGKPEAADRLMPLVYDDLRRQARKLLGRERPGHTLQPTALVHEAYLRLVDQERTDWKGRAHFLAIATILMRRILVDHARKRSAGKRGGGLRKVTLDEGLISRGGDALDILQLDEMLDRLASLDERRGEVASLRLVGGMPCEEGGAVLGV